MTGAELDYVKDVTTGSTSVTEALSNGKSLMIQDFTEQNKITFDPVTSLTVTDTLSVTNSAIDSVTNLFSETAVLAPEPSSLALLAVGVSVFGLARTAQARAVAALITRLGGRVELIAHERGRHQLGIQLIQRALAPEPAYALAHCSLAAV